MRQSRMVALGGILSALCVLILYFGSLLPGYALVSAAVAGLLPAAGVLAGSGVRRYSLAGAIFAVSGLLSLLLLPQKAAAIWYLLFFGYYSIVKSAAEQLRCRSLEWTVKLGVYSAAFWLLRAILGAGFLGLQHAFSAWLLYLLGIPILLLYDVGFSRLIGIYLRRVQRRKGSGHFD